MKTKIIYISGNEVFEMAHIRAAFDEVRSALRLDNDTILFGVPIDCDNALNVPETTDKTISQASITTTESHVMDSDEPIASQEPEYVEAAPEKGYMPDSAPTTVVATESVNEDTTTDSVEPDNTPDNADDDKVIPILSVLSVKDEEIDETAEPVDTDITPADNYDDVEPVVAMADITPTPVSTQEEAVNTDTEPTIVVATNTEISDTTAPVMAESPTDTAVISNIKIDDALDTPMATGDDNANTVSVTIGDMIRDAAPVAPAKNTLEDLLESMKPLREDVIPDAPTEISDDGLDAEWQQEDTDATLAQLASEFAENEDKIVDTAKTETHGKIGKLKSILPFKKRARDDNFPTDNLFGWAGMAANDEDFSIPGFFTPVTSKKKQGA